MNSSHTARQSKTRQQLHIKDLKTIVQKQGSKDAKILIPNAKTDSVGEIKGESALHYLQSTKDKDKFIAHFKSALDKKLNVGDHLKVSYSSKTKATTIQVEQTLSPE